MKQPVIFCDFDGTITKSDNIIAIMKRFAPPGWEKIKDDVLYERVSIREGVGKMFSLLSVELKEEIVQFLLKEAEIRTGFSEFMQFIKQHQIPFYVVSGGIDFFVYPILKEYVKPEQIICNGSDFSGNTIRILWPHACDSFCQNDCGCCKPSFLRRFDERRYKRIVIGDSITDWQAAKMADQVFATDFLQKKCEEQSIPYTPFETFYDIIQNLVEEQP